MWCLHPEHLSFQIKPRVLLYPQWQDDHQIYQIQLQRWCQLKTKKRVKSTCKATFFTHTKVKFLAYQRAEQVWKETRFRWQYQCMVDILQVLNKKIVIYWMINKPNSWHRSSRYNKISMSNIAFCSTLNKTTKEYKTKGKDIHCHHRNLSSQQILKQKFPY
jgi:hypothetical protein